MAVGIYYKVGGVWTLVEDVYIKTKDEWRYSPQTYVKSSGNWVKVHDEVLPVPAAPTLNLELVTTDGVPRYVAVAAGVAVDAVANTQLVRVLTTYNGGAPTSQYGGTYTSEPSSSQPNTPWSDFTYTGSKNEVSKNWPRDATVNNTLPTSKTMYFTAWAQDKAGSWSLPTAKSILIPGVIPIPNARQAELTPQFSATKSRTTTVANVVSGAVYQSGAQTGQISSLGYYGFGTLISGHLHTTPYPSALYSSQIYLARTDTIGAPTVNLSLRAHPFSTFSALQAADNSIWTTGVEIGTLTRGEAKWFTIPSTFYPAMVAGTIAGFSVYASSSLTASGNDIPTGTPYVGLANHTVAKSGQLNITYRTPQP